MTSKNNRGHQSSSRKRRPRRVLRRLIVVSLLVAIAVYLAPTIVGRTPLRNTLLGLYFPAEGWGIECQTASLSWGGRQTLTGVSIVDPNGAPLLTVESATLDRSLLALTVNRQELGKVTLDRPSAYVVTRPDGSNIEELLIDIQSDWSAADNESAPTSQPLQSLEIEIVDGEIRGFDAESQSKWLLDEANFGFQLGSMVPGGVHVQGAANLRASPTGPPGRMQLRMQQIAENQQQLDWFAEHLSLVPLEPWANRLLPGSRLAGTVSTDAEVRWTSDPERGLLVQTRGRLEATELDFSAEVIDGDHLRCERLSSPWQLNITEGAITVGQLEIDAGWAQLSARGSFSPEDLRSLSLESLPKREAAISGRIELQRLATMLPHTLQLREGVQIESGQLEFQAEGKPNKEGFAWFASALLENVAGSDGRRSIKWEQPIEAELNLTDTGKGPRIRDLSLSAPFAKSEFQTTADEVTGSFQLDLGQFSEELGQFVDLDAWQIQGSGEGELTLSSSSEDQFDAAANVLLSNLKVAREGDVIWEEPQLQFDLRSAGQSSDLKLKRIESGSVELRGALDALDLELLAPIDFKVPVQTWEVQLKGNGRLSSWANRLRPWLTATPEELNGDAQLSAKLKLADNLIQVIDSEIDIAELRLREGAMRIDEPRVALSGDCRWSKDEKSFSAREVQLVSSTLAFRSRDVSLKFASSGPPTATGTVAFRADLERLASALGVSGEQDSTWPRGMTVGNLQLASNTQQLLADFSARAEQLQLVRNSTAAAGAPSGHPQVVWTEPQIEAVGKAVYAIGEDRLQVDNFQVNGQTLRVNGSALIEKPTTQGVLRANGLVEYDPAELANLVKTYLGPEVRLQGDRQLRFQVAGPLAPADSSESLAHWSQRWNISTHAGWTAGSVFGLPLSGGRFQGTLSDGQLQIAPVDVAVGQGRLTMRPQARLDPAPQQLHIPAGPLLTNVQVSPQVSETMLKYVAPIVAGATRTAGNFSVNLEGAQVPLNNPSQTRAAGQLEIHRLNVSPGPMVAQLAALVKQIEAVSQRKQFLQAVASPGQSNLLSIEERKIDFQVEQGRVYHRNLEFIVDNVPVRSHGSVGFDQTLALVIEIPIQDKWVEGERSLQSLAGQTLSIPVHGTFQRPRIDERAVADLSRQLLQGVAADAIGNELNRALDKLFKSR